MIKFVLITIVLFGIVHSAVKQDLVQKVPGYGDSFQSKLYAGYLNTSSTLRKLHYVFVQSVNKANNSDPVTLWLNGGPGCSSLLGFLQEIGPFYMEEGVHYKVGDSLKENPQSWHKISNLLFLQSPAGVGYSTNKDTAYKHNDMNTANDNFNALLNFFELYPEYRKNPFWIAGESYAGKYIPDLTVLIDSYNIQAKNIINLKGFLIGNGVMDFTNGAIQKSETEFMIDHDFIDPELIPYYQRSCMADEKSAGCQYFKKRYDDNVEQINPYNVYDYCYYNGSSQLTGNSKKFHSQESILKQFAKKGKFQTNETKNFNGAPCAFFDGLYEYFNAHVKDYHGQTGMTWAGPCNDKVSEVYTIDQSGSMYQYIHLLGQSGKYHMILYNGDWDGVVPFGDTIKNMQKLKLQESYLYTPYFVNNQHAGFIQLYSGVSFITVKGASHQVPQSKRAEAFFLYHAALTSGGSQQKFAQIILN